MKTIYLLPMALLLCIAGMGFDTQRETSKQKGLDRANTPPKPAQVVPGVQFGEAPIPVTPRLRPDCPVRIGGVYTSGLGSSGTKAVSAEPGKLSDENRDWIAANCDVIALNAADITPDTFPAMVKIHRLFTPLLYVYASTLYESSDHRGNAGGWKPEMSALTLRNSSGKEVLHPDSGGHWMDFGSTDWAGHWSLRVGELARQYSAYGAVAAEMPLSNTFVGNDLAKYKTTADRIKATRDWLKTARSATRSMLIPSALGFDSSAGHKTEPTPPGAWQPELSGRLWDEYFPYIDGAWMEGWLRPYWANAPVSASLWEIQLEAADRASRNGQVFIAAAAYHNDAELEFELASYLLVAHRQGRLVFQPMPLRPGEPADAGYNLATLRREAREKSAYFNVLLGVGMQERHQITVQGGPVWRRNFQFGDVYVNSDQRQTVTIPLAGKMRRVNGTLVRKVVLPPRSGVILLYTGK